ncbi:MAG TPA: glycosyltransferase family 2 protein [Puia sp.]|nr:glycosyltransferase family 2 protein [Puia sp.]
MISLVIPVYNEEVLIFDLFARVKDAMESTGEEFEVIVVDDGSQDTTLDRLMECHEKDRRFKILSLSRNFGHQAAYTAGLSYAKGSFIGMMDGDLQDPPELIRDMYRKAVTEKLDIVYGKRIERNEKLSKRIFTRIFHSIFSRLSGLKNLKQVGNFSLMSKRALEAFLSLQEKNRYLPGLRSFVGFKQGYVEYSRPDREQGEAKMSIYKLVTLALDAIFSFSSLPVKICLYSGLVGVILICFALIYILIGKLTGLAPLGWSSIILSVYFIGSVQLVSIGILGEYVFRIYKETQNRPIFLVNRFIE